MTTPDLSRRAFLRGRSAPAERPPIRPPWAKAETVFSANCTRCDACLHACPENILLADGNGLPKVDFSRGECTFCQACVNACEQAAFDAPGAAQPWSHLAAIGANCLGQQGVYCRSCGESCEAGAISFSFSSRAIPIPAIDAAACTGCGACIGACPADAISITPGPTPETASA